MADKEDESLTGNFLSLVFLVAVCYCVYWCFTDTKLGLISSAKQDIARLVQAIDSRTSSTTSTANAEVSSETQTENDEPEASNDEFCPQAEASAVPTPPPPVPARQLLMWYSCDCGTVLKSRKEPNSGGCPGGERSYHIWHELGLEGDNIYQCDRCGNVVSTTNTPGWHGCTESTHNWHQL